jgi:hypothetical protein
VKDLIADELFKLIVYLNDRDDGITVQTEEIWGRTCELLEGHENLPGVTHLLEAYRYYRDTEKVDVTSARRAAREALDARNAKLPLNERVEGDR